MKKHFGEEDVFGFVWDCADADGILTGNAESLAAEFNVTGDEVHATLSELCDRNLIQRVENSTYIITKWRERDEASDEEELSS
jgi:hypothetical protein